MNIFVLDEDPRIAAQYHADQHLHKMILESAQMLSTAARFRGFKSIESWLYREAHPNHPCTLWVKSSNHNMHWLCDLAISLNSMRVGDHGSMDVIYAVKDYLEDEFPYCHYRHVESFVFAGPPTIAISQKLTIPEKYQKYYRQKHRQWLLDRSRGMTYKNRPIPPFMADLISPNGT